MAYAGQYLVLPNPTEGRESDPSESGQQSYRGTCAHNSLGRVPGGRSRREEPQSPARILKTGRAFQYRPRGLFGREQNDPSSRARPFSADSPRNNQHPFSFDGLKSNKYSARRRLHQALCFRKPLLFLVEIKINCGCSILSCITYFFIILESQNVIRQRQFMTSKLFQ